MNTVAENGKTIFLQTLDLPTPQDRQRFLDAACAGNSLLRQEVEQLLAHHEQAGEFLESPPTELVVARGHDTTPDAAAPELDFLAPADGGQALGRLGYYDILEVIGSGGFGVVLKARDSTLDRIVAIKTLAQALASSATARKRFVREAKAAAAVNHENVVDIHAVSDEGPVPYLVMEYVHGLSLDEKLKQAGALDLRAILRIGMQIASGLAAAHQQGLVHRDVKPANILLQNGVERVKITDFGLARTVDDVTLTQTGIIAGTPAYMSPEQAHGEAVDHRSDLFSLGSVLYALCTGRSPFRAETTMATLRRVCDDTPRPIRDVNPDMPLLLVAIVDRLLAKDPAERFQTAGEVADLLGHHLAQLQHPTSPLIKETTHPQSKITNQKSKTQSRWAIAAAALVLLLVGLSLTEATGVTRFAPTVMRIVTGKGTLLVEVHDPAIKVTVEGDGGLVISGAGLHEVNLKPGTYQLRADKDGQRVPLNQELVTISHGGKEVVRVLLEATSAVAAADPSLTPTAEGFTPLFNGKDLTGWAVAGGGTGTWKIEDGALTCTGPRDHLLTTRNDFGDFHLRAEVKINAHGNSGIYFRTSKPLVLIGDYEAQISDNPGQGYKTGSLYGLVRVSESPIPPNTWFIYEIIAVGKRIRILVNGQETAQFTEDRDGRNTQGHIALQHHDPESRVFFRKVEVKELPSGNATANGAFVLLGGKGVAERKFDTLTDAVQGASDGDTIEIRGNGPFATRAIDFRLPLTIRAGAGFRPVIKADPEMQGVDFWLRSYASLVLEGLELQWLDPIGDRTKNCGLLSTWSPTTQLHVANCRFLMTRRPDWSINGIFLVGSAQVEIRNCQFLMEGRGNGIALGGDVRHDAIVDNCLILGRVVLHPSNQPAKAVLSRNTILGRYQGDGSSLAINSSRKLGPPVGNEVARPLQVEMLANILESPTEFSRAPKDPAPEKALTASEAAQLLTRLVGWQEKANLYAFGDGELLKFKQRVPGGELRVLEPTVPLQSVADLQSFWATEEIDFQRGTVRFQGEDRIARSRETNLHLLTPDDFRLREGSAGYLAGPDGKDLGADVDLVGPGAAYERWKKAPEYQQWLKDTNQVKAELPQPVKPFVVLAIDGKADQSFPTLAMAIAASKIGDVVEIRTNGPIITPRLSIPVDGLTIRAAAGFVPVVQLQSDDSSGVLISNSIGRLALEGLELRLAGFKPAGSGGGPRIVNCSGFGRIHIAHCHLHVSGGGRSIRVEGGRSLVQVRNSLVFGPIWFDGERLVAENSACCNRQGPVCASPLEISQERSLQFQRCSLVGSSIIEFLDGIRGTVPDDGPPPLRCEVSNCILDGRDCVLSYVPWARVQGGPPALPAEARSEILLAAFKRRVSWQAEHNAYPANVSFLGRPESVVPARRIKTLADWNAYWDVAEENAVQGLVKFQAGDVRDALAPTPQDFRLLPGSLGSGAADGKDLGPDLDLVGPGPAYERWKQTPEYQEWLKETGQKE